jgi:heterodisulfide reductase subunit B
MKMAYYPGCSLKDSARNYDLSTKVSAEALGLQLVELERWNCCGTVHSLAKDDVMHYLAPIRNLLRVEEFVARGVVEKGQLVTSCAMCYNTLKRANLDARGDPEKMEKIRDVMDREETRYSGGVEVLHLLEVLRGMGWSRTRERVIKPLSGLRVAPYYGCLLLRPRGIGVDDADNPKVMENMLEALGASVVDYPYNQKCCGSYLTVQMREVVADLCRRIMDSAASSGAEILVTGCPLEIGKLYPDFEGLPVVYFTQLMALAFGLEEETYGFEDNHPDPRPLLEAKGFL